jgi:hypothetical protein
VARVRSPPIVGVTANPGKRRQFCFLLSLWEVDEQGGTTVYWFLAEGRGAGASSANPSGTSQVVDRRPPSRVPSAISNRGFNECQDGRATPPPERDPFSVGPLRSAMTAQRRLQPVGVPER